MRTALLGGLLALAAMAPCAVGAAQPEPPTILLYIPFDGTPEATLSASGQLKTSYVAVSYRPGVRAQGALIGSDRYPSGLVIPSKGVFDKSRGTVEFWFMPLWDPADPTQEGVIRTLISDELSAGEVGHFGLTIQNAALHFALQGKESKGISAPIHRWKRESWHHVAATWDATWGIRLFLDGERAAELELRWVLPPSDRLYVGATRAGANRAEGLFDELRIYDRALTPTEVELANIRNLPVKEAPVAPPKAPAPAPEQRRPARLSFHLTFDNIIEAQRASGDAKPVVAEGAQFAQGLLGEALVAGTGLNLTYQFDKNLSKEAGAITLWTRALPEKKTWRGILVGDNLQGAGEPRDTPGSVALWLQREAGIRGTFTLWPLEFRQTFDRWDSRDWYHLAACWRRGEEARFYVNGREAGRTMAGQAIWDTGVPKQIHVGSLGGRLPANALIDDVRFYDAPLTPGEVKAEACRFLLPLAFLLDRTLFERGQPGDLPTRFFNTMDEELKLKITVRVLNPDGREAAATTANVETPARGWARLRIPLTAEALASEGLYEVVTHCPGRTACPRANILVVAPEPKQAASGGEAEPSPRLERGDTINCSRVNTRGAFCESGNAHVVKSPLGSYMETGLGADSRMAYRFEVKQLGIPHVAVVSYPADRARSAEIIMTSPHYPASYDVATGYFVDPADAMEPRMVEFPIYFWPREKENAIVFRTLVPGRPAACARITIRRLPDGLPRARVEEPQEGGRTFGSYWHDPAAPTQFGATATNPPDVYESFRRLIDYLGFTGQNLLCYPVAWHQGVLYPAEREEFRQGLGSERHCQDWIEYVLALCERRGIQFVPEIVFDDCFALSAAYGAQTAESLAAGAESARMVLWNDTLSRGGPSDPPRYNPVHPAVRDTLLERVDEIAERYGKSPALAGVSLHLGPSQSAWFASIECGYGDWIVGEFERDIGQEVPEGRSGPTRFSERARWLLANRYDQWVNWRCGRLRQVYADLASRLQNKRPDLTLFLTLALPDSSASSPLTNLTAWASRGNSFAQLCREAGLDIELYEKRPKNLVVRKVLFPVDAQHILSRAGEPTHAAALADDLNFLSEASAPLQALPRTGAVCSYRYFDSSVGAQNPMSGFWWRSHPLRASHPTPMGRKFLEPCAHALAELDVTNLSLGGRGPISMGHEAEVREFARAFRALPPERFTSIAGLSDPVCARELSFGLGHFFYLVNRISVPVDAYVAFKIKDVTLHDFVAGKDLALPYVEGKELPGALPEDFASEHALPFEEGLAPAEGRTQKVTGSLLQVRLEPYQLLSYRVRTAGAGMIYAATATPPEYRVRLGQRMASARGIVAHSNAGPEVLNAARVTLDLIRRAWRKGEYSRVEHLLDSYPLARLR